MLKKSLHWQVVPNVCSQEYFSEWCGENKGGVVKVQQRERQA